jgi:hypothetical protein
VRSVKIKIKIKIKIKVKVKLSLCLTKNHAMKTCSVFNYTPRNEDVWVSGGIALRILNLGSRCR